MRVLLDGYWWHNGPPSGRHVLRSLAITWARDHLQDEVTVLLPSDGPGLSAELRQNLRLRRTRSPQHALACLSCHPPRRQYDFHLTQNFTAVSSRVPRGVFIHDLIFERHPEWFTRSERLYLKAVPHLARAADLVFTSSNSEAHAISQAHPRLGPKTRAVGLGVPVDFTTAKPVRPQRLQLTEGRFVLTVGRLNVRKNIHMLATSLRASGLISQQMPLVVVGAVDGAQASGAVEPWPGDVLFTGYLPVNELRWLYEGCALFSFPSLDEAFGLPVLEALSANAPLALSEIPAFREFGLPAYYFEPTSRDSIVAAHAAALAVPRPAGRDPLLRLRTLQEYSWSRVVENIRSSIIDII